MMIREIELSSLNCRYESYRLRNEGAERILLSSIAEQGIRDPLEGVDVADDHTSTKLSGPILLNGFKRLRCARKLGIQIVPYVSIGTDPAMGIISLLRMSNAKGLSILEQAALVDELKKTYQLSVSEIAQHLERSKSWVSMRSGILAEMSEVVRQKLFSGKFPVYSYMYTLRSFMRMNKTNSKDIDEFVSAVAGKKVSVRDVERLAHGYFKGSEEFREQIRNGNIVWGLQRMKEPQPNSPQCNELERGLLNDLEVSQKYMTRVIHKSQDSRLKSLLFMAQANLLAGGILRQLGTFSERIKALYAHTGQV
jgi:predicted transcriptional regulator